MPPWPFSLEPHEEAAIYISDGERLTEQEYTGTKVAVEVAKGAKGISKTAADGILLTATDYEANGIVVAGGTYTIGGEKDYYTLIPNVDNHYVGTEVAAGFDAGSDYNFNSVLLFGLDADVPADAKTGSCAIDAANDGEVLYLENVYVQVDGAQRYASSTFLDATTVVNSSYLVTTGNVGGFTDSIALPFSNEALLISGAARTNFTIGTSHTYYYNSTVIAEGWASLSTDASTGDGLDLYAYNTKAYALNGGYGAYADFTCRVWLYGSYLEAAEVGGILSKSGEIYVFDGASATEDILAYNTGATTSEGSHVKAGRNALMVHAPDMGGEGLPAVDHGTIRVVKSTLETSDELESTFGYGIYGEDVLAYINYIKGDVILVKSTSATIALEEATLKSSNGVLFHTVLNSDRMGNFLAAGDNKAKNEENKLIVQPVTLSLSNMSAEGNILHDDYQRNMLLELTSTQLQGRINQGTHKSWTSLWAEKGITEAYWLPNEAWSASNELSVRIDGRSRWVVTGSSAMTSLIVEKGATISAPPGHQLTMVVNGKEVPVSPGRYEGKIVLTVSKIN